MGKRIFLFLLTNILIITTISIILSVLGVGNYITDQGLDYGTLAIFCLVWGFAGSFISLAISRWMAKRALGVEVIDPQSPGRFAELQQMVAHLSKSAGLNVVPEVGVYDSPEVNAFATGPTKNRSLVAFSSGLLNSMSRQEIEGVAAHEIAHIKNGDMVTMTLLQGVINAFVMFFARVIAFGVSQSVKEESRAMVNMLVVIVLQILLGILGSVVVCWFSRQREFRADYGAGKIGGKEKMLAALERLQKTFGAVDNEDSKALATMKINGTPSKFMALFSTHPPLEQRIAVLKAAQ